ncbi:MAG TPA: pseudouridine-5'-phosphate glycosidase [Acidobacteriota bacterium]|nr:pseudouridine-5'-phosphate glycosidase [Acidobacteriota bacterium]
MKYLEVAQRIRGALDANQPVVALESTLIVHGMPWPDNLKTAFMMEAVVRQEGAEPAVIAVEEGAVRVGLDEDQLRELADGGYVKAGTRDLPGVLAGGEKAATTVASTIYLAHLAGISVMATGGIGGVHRDAWSSGDVSGDLQELARTPLTVVCSGAKSILDLPLTLEALETLGIAVVGYRTDEFPAFYSRGTGLPVPRRADSPQEIASIVAAARALKLPSAVLVVQPPPEDEALDAAQVEAWTQEALSAARARGVRGKDVTPYLLRHIQEAGGKRVLRANRSLAICNARLAAQIARGRPPRPDGSTNG